MDIGSHHSFPLKGSDGDCCSQNTTDHWNGIIIVSNIVCKTQYSTICKNHESNIGVKTQNQLLRIQSNDKPAKDAMISSLTHIV
jgi:hypothetical protein